MCPLTTMKKDMPSVYDSLRTINRSFEEILQALEHLDRFDWFSDRPPMKSVGLVVQETRAWTVSEILDVLHQREESEWMRFGSLRSAREKHLNVGVESPVKPMRRKRRKISRV